MWVGKQLRKLANFAGIASLLVMWFWEEMMVPLIIMFLYIQGLSDLLEISQFNYYSLPLLQLLNLPKKKKNS